MGKTPTWVQPKYLGNTYGLRGTMLVHGKEIMDFIKY